MPACKVCGSWFVKIKPHEELCDKCECALCRLSGYVAQVRHGRWLDRPKNQGLKDEEIGTVGMVDGEPWSSCYCSECGEWLVASDEYAVKGNYCPNCGAKMDGGEDR